jgi:hypothetical protein
MNWAGSFARLLPVSATSFIPRRRSDEFLKFSLMTIIARRSVLGAGVVRANRITRPMISRTSALVTDKTEPEFPYILINRRLDRPLLPRDASDGPARWPSRLTRNCSEI